MNISSFKAFETILYRAWQARYIFLAQVTELSKESFQAYSLPKASTGRLIDTARYYQEIQNQGFYPCIIHREEKRDSAQWVDFIQWLHHQEHPFLCVFTGPPTEDSLIMDAVEYFISKPILSDNTPFSLKPSSVRLRADLLRAFQSDIRRQPLSARAFIEELLNHITENYQTHQCSSETALVLKRIFEGLSGSMPDPTILERQIKWSLFEYLAELKGKIAQPSESSR